jgi:hypothetical protein
MEYVSVGLSVLAATSSLYVWLVTANSERPRLRTHLVDEPQDRVNGNADLYYLSKFRKGVKLEGLFYYLYLKTVVMNDSSLPTTVVRLKCSIKAKDGTWKDATVAYGSEADEEKAHPLGGNPSPLKPDWRELTPAMMRQQDSPLEVKPIVIPPRQGVFIRMLVWSPFAEPEVPEGGDYKKLWRDRASELFASPPAVKVELTGLQGVRFTDILTGPATDADDRSE